jgi:hypothetical protein
MKRLLPFSLVFAHDANGIAANRQVAFRENNRRFRIDTVCVFVQCGISDRCGAFDCVAITTLGSITMMRGNLSLVASITSFFESCISLTKL